MNLIILLCIIHVVWTDNVDVYHEKSMIEFHGSAGLRNESLFGYSTTYDRYNKRLIISAPRENNIGEVYDCDIATTSCSKIGRNIHEHDRYKHDYWFGATVRAGSSFIVACAPRFTAVVSGYANMHGRCYRRSMEKNTFSSELKPLPTIFNSKRIPEQDMETLGWDMDIGPDDNVIVGGPGMFNKKGLAAYTKGQTNTLIRILANADVSFNFGYSVAAGYFTETDKLSYAVGSIYGSKGPGQVYFYTYGKNRFDDFTTQLKKEVDIDLVGSMFGAVLCAANLAQRRSGTNSTDLLVGAPTYVDNFGYNAGAVYVYIFRGKRHSPFYKRTIKSRKDGSFFGAAIITLGDLNGDGADEVAIGAPYEDDGNGAVYLYSGASLSSDKTEHALTWLQRLQPSGRYRSFGLSLATLHDYDENGCNELAVSAPYEDKVVLYRCMAAVTITGLTASFPNLQDRSKTNTTEFKFEVCVNVKYPPKPKEIYADISTDVQINHQNAKLSKPNKGLLFNFNSSLRDKSSQYCATVDITLPLDGDYGTEIGYEISTTLLDSPVYKKDFDKRNVILSDVSKFHQTGSVWAAECTGNKECISNLTLTIDSSISEPFTIGSSDKGTLKINVQNSGEVAYDPCVHIKVEGASAYITPIMDCAAVPEQEHTWECTSRKPLRNSMHWNIDFVVSLNDLTSKDSRILFNVILFNSCKLKNTTRQSHRELNIGLISSTEDVYIKGSDNFMNMTQDDLLINGQHLEQIYMISNKGVTNFIDLKSEIKLQKETFLKYSETPVSYYTDVPSQSKSEHRKCETVLNTTSELTIQCVITSLPKQTNVKVVVSADILPSSDVYEAVTAHNVTVNSSIILHLPHEQTRTGQTTTLITLNAAYVAIWILILAGIVGLCLIIILAMILYECGFLRRKNKQELEKLRTSVKRQTIRRSMMQQPHADDRLNILERMEEVDESPVDVVQQPHP